MESTQPETQVPPITNAGPEADWKRVALDILETIVLAVVLYFGINAVSARVRVDGFSMNPSLANGEYILVNKLAYKTGEPARGRGTDRAGGRGRPTGLRSLSPC